MGRCRTSEFTDEELDVMSYRELETIAHGTLSYSNIHRRINVAGWSRRRACTQSAGGCNHAQPDDHPLKKFKGEFYSQTSKARHAEVKKSWRKL